MASRGNAGETQDAIRCHPLRSIENDRRSASAFDDEVRSKAVDAADMISSAQRAHEVWLGPGFGPIKDVEVAAALMRQQRSQEPDRPGSGHQHASRLPPRSTQPDPLDLIPGFRHDARGLQKDTAFVKSRIEVDDEIRFDSKAVGGITITTLDASLGVETVSAHVPFTTCAGGAWNRIGSPDDPHHEISRKQFADGGRRQYASQRFVSNNEPIGTRWRRT